MFLVDVKTGERIGAKIERVTSSDLKKVKREKNFVFNWNVHKTQEVYKLVIKDNEIMGLMCVEDRAEPGYNYLEIELIEVRKDQRGALKKYDRIAGCLLAFAADKSFALGHEGFLALTSKTKTAPIYYHKYGFFHLVTIDRMEIRMASNRENSLALIERYLEN